VAVVAIGTPDGARQRQANFSRPDLLVGAHRADQILHLARSGTFDGQMQPLQDRPDALRGTRLSDAE